MRQKPPEKWVLPSVIDPPNRRCIQVQVPDDPAHIAAFRGAMLMLQAAYNWADDPAHTARLVALVWRDIIDGMNTWGCGGMQTILREDPDGCGIQWSLDDGATWETIDLSTCITALAEASFNVAFPGAFSDALAQAIADGQVQEPGTQTGPSNPPGPGGCASVHVVLQARENWVCPFPVQAGSTIHVTGASGGWNDGATYWYCPDGNSYGMGWCTPDTAHYELTDPYASAHHMTVVGRLLDSGLWFDPSTSVYTVPAGQAQQLFILQANDQSLSDNYGEIQFDVEVCSNPDYAWCYSFDFLSSDGGFATPGAAYGGIWDDGVGWRTSMQPNGYWNVVIQKAWASAHVIRVVMEGTRLTTDKYAEVRIINGPTTILTYSGHLDKPFQFDTHAIDITSTGLSFYIMTDSGLGFADNVIQRITVYGDGPNPFPGSNC